MHLIYLFILLSCIGQSIWPVMLALTSLPPALRMNVSNLILAGIWLGPVKPKLEMILQPVLEKLKVYGTKGITISTNGIDKVIKVKLILCVFDLVARPLATNTLQFNGYFGCLYCLDEGVYELKRMLYPPLQDYIKRCKEDMESWATLAERLGKPMYGVKGHSVLSLYIDIVRDIPIDYMHMILEGISKMLLKYWLDESFKDRRFYIGKDIDKLDKMLLRIKPPHSFRRSPRSLKVSSTFWKASEHQAWLLYYAIPLLMHILPPDYVIHLSLLITSLHILLGTCIRKEDITKCRELLKTFHELLPELYPKTLCTANFHMLAHICDCVEDWGPLWCYSTFGFENLNGYLRKYAHGTGNILPQLVESFMMHQASSCAAVPHENNDETISFIKYLNKSHHEEDNRKCKQLLLPKEEMDALLKDRMLVEEERVSIVPSFKIHNEEVKPRPMIRKRKRDSSVCQIKYNENLVFVSVRRFCMINGSVIGIGNVFETLHENIFNDIGTPCIKNSSLINGSALLNHFLFKVRKLSVTNAIVTFAVNAIIQLCVHIPIKHSATDYIVVQPNHFEHH